eukprot:11756597-Alexandrium_andersonii.AAC.1
MALATASVDVLGGRRIAPRATFGPVARSASQPPRGARSSAGASRRGRASCAGGGRPGASLPSAR